MIKIPILRFAPTLSVFSEAMKTNKFWNPFYPSCFTTKFFYNPSASGFALHRPCNFSILSSLTVLFDHKHRWALWRRDKIPLQFQNTSYELNLVSPRRLGPEREVSPLLSLSNVLCGFTRLKRTHQKLSRWVSQSAIKRVM